MSGGEGQRVRFGRGLGRPDARLVILDEPFRGLERSRRATLLRRAREQWSRATLVCVTHDVGETATLRPGPRRLQRSRGRGRRTGRSGGPGRLALSSHPRRGDHASRSGCGRIPSWRTLRLEDGRIVPAAQGVASDTGDVNLADPPGRRITKAAGGRVSGIAAICWPIQRAPEGLELLARAARLPCRPTHRSSEAEPRAQDVDASLKDAAAGLGLEVGDRRRIVRGDRLAAALGRPGGHSRRRGRGRDARETTRAPADRDRTRPSRSSGSGRRRCGARSSILKRRRSSPMPKGSPTKPVFAPPIDPPSRARSSRNGCVRGACAACWLLRIPSGASFGAQITAVGGRRQLVLLALAHAEPVRALDRRLVAAWACCPAGPTRCVVARGVDARAPHAGAAPARGALAPGPGGDLRWAPC